MPSEQWFTVYTKPRQERRAAANLTAWGVETFLPRMRQSRAQQDTTPDDVTAMFPRYLFARFDVSHYAAKVRYTRGVAGIVGFGEFATPVDDSIIAMIRSRTAPDGILQEREPMPGELVEIVGGPLRSLVGVFERELSGRSRVLILLTAIGARAQAARAHIRSLSATPIAG
jgi:transcriptional antiterminator RfaH